MEIRDRIESCLNDLDMRRRRMAAFERRIRALMKTLQAEGGTPGALGEVLSVLDAVLKNYDEIDFSCRHMIDGLKDVGQHLDRIEEGRRKIIAGVEKILGHLSKLDELARQGIAATASPEARKKGSKRPKKVLLIRLQPKASRRAGAGTRRQASDDPDPFDDEELDLTEGEDTVVH